METSTIMSSSSSTEASNILGFPPHWNNSTQNLKIEDLKMDSNMAWLIFSLVSAIGWVIYITFYNSRVFGYFITKLVNRLFIKGAYFKLGSFTINPLAGKIMFRDVVYINFDYTVRIQDGYIIFRWWRSYVPKDVSEDLSHSDTRLSIMLYGLELHVYNRSELYAKLEKTFGLKPSILLPTENMSAEESAKIREECMNVENQRQSAAENDKRLQKKARSEAMAATTWRDLIPVIKFEICSGRFVFGNRLTPTTLSICVEEAHCVYSTKPAVSKLDHFMHFVKAKSENSKILLAPSPKYTGLVDDPPRYMGEGFVVMMSNCLELYLYMDEPGIVPEEPAVITLANGDVVQASPPVWGLDIKCGKGTNFSYGPWADRQRDHLFKFFYPPDWQTMVVTQPPKPGERRQYQQFDMSLCTLNNAVVDVLFSKNKETNAVHVNVGPGTYLEATIPWITLQDGFTTKVTGQLLHVEATTSLQYRSLAECETLQFTVKVHYPMKWNDHQDWLINLTGSKATAFLVYSHKDFFQDMIEDWASKSRPDILSFVPYTWKFCILLKEFEIITNCNQYNWIDCSSTNQENHHLAFCGDLFDLSFNLPFDDFLPMTVPLKFWIHGEGLDLSMYLPEISTSRPILLGLDENARIMTRDGSIKKIEDIRTNKWRRICLRPTGWVDCWTVPIVALAIQYIYHPMPPLGPDPQADITTPEKEEILLSPLKMPKMKKSPAIPWAQMDSQRFDPTTMTPDRVTVEIEIGSSVLMAYGAVLKNFIYLKENIFGEDQSFTDMETSNTKLNSSSNSQNISKTHKDDHTTTKSLSESSFSAEEKPKAFDPRLYRPIEVTVTLTIHDIQAHVMKNCNDNDPPCPVVLIERLGFEMKKRFNETELQILVSPSYLISSDNVIRPSKDRHLKQGHLLLSALQIRGHAMFSNEGLNLNEDTLEYAWLLEVQLGKLSGKLTLPQLCHVVTGLETLVLLAVDSENDFRPTKLLRYCHHGMPSNQCPQSLEDNRYRCPSCEDIKYRMTRVSVDAIDLYFIESGTALHTWISPIRFSTCNLHGQQVKSGITGLIPTILLRQFVSTSGHFNHVNGNSHSNTNTTGSGRSTKLIQHQNSKSSDDRKDDLNLLFKRDENSTNAIKSKKESEYGLYRKESKEKDESFNRRSRDSEFHYRRDKDDVYSSIYSSGRDRNREIDCNDPWLEVGCVSLGPIIFEAASALPIPEHCLHLVQHNYLKVHDTKHKRLTFLWSSSMGNEQMKCGCVGGCTFFGSNRNGPKFFKPSAQDLQDGVNIARYHIHPNLKEYGFGQSLLYEGQLVFHTPPYSLQSVTLQECYEYINRGNLRSSRHCMDSSKSPLPQKHEILVQHNKHDVSPNSSLIRHADKGDKSSKVRDRADVISSPLVTDSRGRRFSYTHQSRTPIPVTHDVPYARLLDSPSKNTNVTSSTSKFKDQYEITSASGLASIPYKVESDARMIPKSLKVSAQPKTSASDSRLTAEYFPGDDDCYESKGFDSMSHSAPQPNPLECDSEYSLSPRVTSEETIISRDVQRTISLTSENPSEAFFSADEENNLHASRSSSLKNQEPPLIVPKKRFASDLSIGGGGCGPNEQEGRLSSHRSDYEIHTPEHRSLSTRPQSTAELNDDERRIHGIATPLRKISNISPRPEFRHIKPTYDMDSHQDTSSDSPSLSSNSFISALSSQEDITLVNLHMQVNRPIVDSPLLMASYVTHLAQTRCPNWSHCSMPFGGDAFSVPLFQQNEDGGLVYIGGKLLPHFDTCSNYREIRITSRVDTTNTATNTISMTSNIGPKSHPWDPSVMVKESSSKAGSENTEENEFIGIQGESATRNSVVVRFKGQVDVMLTPLLLEGLQRATSNKMNSRDDDEPESEDFDDNDDYSVSNEFENSANEADEDYLEDPFDDDEQEGMYAKRDLDMANDKISADSYNTDQNSDINNADNTDYEDSLYDDSETSDSTNDIASSAKHQEYKRYTGDYTQFTDDEITAALAKLTPNELDVLNKLVESDSNLDGEEKTRDTRSIRKYHFNQGRMDSGNDEEDVGDNDNKHRCFGKNCKGACIVKKHKYRGKRSDDTNSTSSSNSTTSAEPDKTSNVTVSDTSNKIDSDSSAQLIKLDDLSNKPSSLRKAKRHTSNYYKNFNGEAEFADATTDRKIQAKINYLRDKYKRDSISKRKPNDKFDDAYIRRKRESSLNEKISEDPTSPEHIKLLEESFPNPDNSFQSNEPLVRVKRMIESLIPTLSSLHSLTIVNYLHGSCVRKVEEVNILKRDQSLSYWSQVHSNSKRSTAERNLQGPGGPVMTDVYEESISTQLQGLIVLPKINVSLVQTSVVEEVISFAALDNVHDLSCASLLAVCIESISTRFHFGKTTKASMHTVYTQPAVRSNGLKKNRIIKGTRALWAHLSSTTRPDNIPGEPVLIETSEKQLEELVITLDVGKAHAQLRRLKNEGCALSESQTIVTAIPNHRSRALFECNKYPEDPNCDPSLNGFIMFECGLEGVCVKIVKRSQFEKSENNEDKLKTTDTIIDANLSNITTNPLNTSTETTASSAAAKAADFLKLNIKKPTTPKLHTHKDRTSVISDTSHVKEKCETPKLRDEEKGEIKVTPGPSTAGGNTSVNANSTSDCKNTSNGSNKNGMNNSSLVECSNDNGKTSSCVIDFKTVWFNFAAPPRVPITRKIDCTRLDWNLLSTASPAITAWMNPSNRFAIKLVSLMKTMFIRRTAVAACLMAEVLEQDQNKYRATKSRYSGKFTPLAKTLQEDPSCQLCTIMQKYVNQEKVSKVEQNLKQQDLPPLTTLRQGVIVLSRQWKNTLYNPMLFEHQYKNKLNRPFNVAFPINGIEEDCDDADDLDTETFNPPPLNETEENEHSMLLGQSTDLHHVIKLPDETIPPISSKYTDSINTSPSMNSGKTRKKSLKTIIPQAASSSRSSIPMFPIISGLVDKQDNQIEYGTLRDGSLPSICSSTDTDKNWSPPPNHKEDLYSWMAKQQVDANGKSNSKNTDEMKHVTPPKAVPTISGGTAVMQDSTRLIDAHLIFEPLLTCLGVMPQQMVNSVGNSDIASFENLGTNLSLVGSFDTMRIDIVVSETTTGDKKTKPKLSKKSNGKFQLILPAETPAFLCERVGVELEVLKMADKLSDEAKQHVLYLSRGQLKKHTQTVINFSLNVRYISQQVNMPLLRLLHQITNMYQNVKEAQNELREQPETEKRNVHQKDESSLASEIHEPTLTGSIHEQPFDISLLDERYDKFNEQTPSFGPSVSRSRVSNWNPLVPTTPSPNTQRNRPQSFAQKIRSTGKTVKGKLGYTNLNETISTPVKTSPTASTFEQAFQKSFLEPKNSLTGGTSSIFGGGALINEAFTDLAPIDQNIFGRSAILSSGLGVPKCWKTIYHLLDLYATMPETKTITHRVSISPDAADHLKTHRKYNLLHDTKSQRDDDELGGAGTPLPIGIVSHERTRLVVFGIVKIHRTRLLASLSGLKLEAEITALQSSATWRKKSRPASLECSLTGQVGRAMIVLLEGVAPNQQTVVRVTFGKSQTLYSSMTRRSKDKNSGLLTIGPINIDIPQHPVALHGMMTRSSKQLSSTLQELRVTRTSTRLSRQNEEPDSPLHQREPKEKFPTASAKPVPQKSQSTQTGLLQPLVMQFNIVLQSLSITAALLPSLQAQYKMDHVTSTGVTGGKAKFTIDLPSHFLSFTTKIHAMEANLPSEACIALPPVHVSAEYISENAPQDTPLDGIVLRQGGYVAALAEIGTFERCLTTDLLNHLVFVQKVFMKEVNEVVQKVYGGEKPVPLWLEESEDNGSSLKRILFNLNIRMKRIQLTATTPCSSAVRFETGVVELQLSNRVKNIADGSPTKLFGKAQIDLNLSLGQIIKNALFDEAEPEFQQYAFFNTTIGLRNAFQNEMLNEDKELVLITLKRPLIYVQPIAVDKAILVWLNYKNAYEYWTEKRANLNKEVLTATQQIFEKVPFGQFSHHLSGNTSTVFLQLTVEDMGICLPLKTLPPSSWGPRSTQDFESRGAVVITLENTIISACSSGSLVSNGRFVGLCLRFADDFETSLDDWKPNMSDSSIMNLCVVSEGTYEVCSRTIAAKQMENAKWFLNVKWQMEGVDIHLDVNIGKQLSALGHTLTMLTGYEEEDDPTTLASPDSEEGDQDDENKPHETSRCVRKTLDTLPDFVFDPNIDPKKRSMLMEKEMKEQFKIISDLRTLGASHNTIAYEERRLQELQAVCYKYFRRDIIQKWKRPSMRRPLLKTTNRSRSFVVPSPTREDLLENENGTLDTIFSNDGEPTSLKSSPQSGPSRSSSLKVRLPNVPRVTFNDSMRQSSLPSADSDVTFSDTGLDWPTYNGSVPEVPNTIDVDGEQVELRKKSISHSQKQQEPNIDFELDIKVLVNSGKCVLHTKEINDEKITATSSSINSKHHKRQQSTGTDWGSPVPTRRSKDKSSRFRYNTAHSLLVDLTIFHIPGLDVKLHYESKTLTDETSPRLSTCDASFPTFSGIQSTTTPKRYGSKRASLFAWIILQSIPEETIISPHILEFLEQTLEPIPSNGDSIVPSNQINIDLLQTNYVAYSSFPVDVIVYFHMQPSTFRFSCLPVSRVECMLQLPSLDIVFSSKRQEDDSQPIEGNEKSSSGGLSVTGCLADFNVYIFHPYGGKKTSSSKGAQFSPLADSERKDSLSINVEFVKFHITRSKKMSFETLNTMKKTGDQSHAVIRFSTIVDIGSASFKYDMRRLTEILAFPKAWYRHSIVRRLFLGDLSIHQTSTGDLDFTPSEEDHQTNFTSERSPLLTTREKLRLSLENDIPKKSGGNKLNKKSLSLDSNTSPSEPNQSTSWETLVLFGINFTKLNVQMNMGNVMGNVIWLTKAFRSDGCLSIGSTGHKNMYIGVSLGGSVLDAKGGIVGGTIELNKIDTFVRIHEEPGNEPHHTVGIKLLALELRLDYMGTSILMTRVSALNATLRDEWKNSKDYNDSATRRPAIILIHGDLSWDQLQMMISKSTTADLLKMFYKLEEFFSQQFKSSKRIFSNLEPKISKFSTGSFKRRQFQMRKRTISINENNGPSVPNNNGPFNYKDTSSAQDAKHHRHWQKPLKQSVGLFLTSLGVPLPNSGTVLGGTMELHGKNISLACFHGINFKSKYWALFSLREPCINFATEAQEIEKSGEVHIIQTLTFGLGMSSQNTTPQHHSMASVYRVSRNIIFPPQFKTLHEWFHYAFANSDIDGIDNFPVIERDREINTNSIERVRGNSNNTAHPKLQDPKHHRELIFAFPSLQLHFKTEHLQGAVTPDTSQEKPVVECSFITEFEDHIFVSVDADTFFFLHDLISSYMKEKEKVIATQTARSASPNPTHIPSMHHQHPHHHDKMGGGSTIGSSTNLSTSHSSVATSDSNITSVSSSNGSGGATNSSKLNQGSSSASTLNHLHTSDADNLNKVDMESFLKDWRHFNCKTWHLEPTVRLHSSLVGKSIEPYGIDYILNKLGFSHARTTIPKWLQRGFMDPLDKVEAILMIQLLSMVRENRNQT